MSICVSPRYSYKQELWVCWPHRIFVQLIWIHERWFAFVTIRIADFVLFNFLISSSIARPFPFYIFRRYPVPVLHLCGGLHPVVSGPHIRLIRMPPLHIKGLIILSFGGSTRVFSDPSPMMCETSFLVDWVSLSLSPFGFFFVLLPVTNIWVFHETLKYDLNILP
jgi:hypothetical protein